MGKHLTAGQHALLEAALLQRQHQIESHLASHQEGLSRAEHAREILKEEGHDAPEREAERQLDMTISDRGMIELGQVSAALRRLRDGDYGDCEDCGDGIPFDRLKAEPWALRCIDCESRREAEARRRG